MSDDFMKVCEWFPLKLYKMIIGLARLSDAGSNTFLNDWNDLKWKNWATQGKTVSLWP